jgi:hypothetical protein
MLHYSSKFIPSITLPLAVTAKQRHKNEETLKENLQSTGYSGALLLKKVASHAKKPIDKHKSMIITSILRRDPQDLPIFGFSAGLIENTVNRMVGDLFQLCVRGWVFGLNSFEKFVNMFHFIEPQCCSQRHSDDKCTEKLAISQLISLSTMLEVSLSVHAANFALACSPQMTLR